jgi:hypothetical protein
MRTMTKAEARIEFAKAQKILYTIAVSMDDEAVSEAYDQLVTGMDWTDLEGILQESEDDEN